MNLAANKSMQRPGTELKKMERKLLRNHWNEMRWQIGEWWDELTDEDLDRISGDQDRLITVLQERYGYTRNLAYVEVKIRLADYRPNGQERIERNSDKNDIKAMEYSIYDFDDWLESSNARASRAKAHTHLEVAQIKVSTRQNGFETFSS